MLGPGDPVPDFSLRRENGQPFTREDLEGKTTVLVFYPFAFSPVCTDQLQVYDGVLDDFTARGVTLYGVSCDASWSLKAFRQHLGVRIEQLSDFEPKGETSRAFGVYFEPAGMSSRALVIVGPDLLVRWSYLQETRGEFPAAQLIFEALATAGAPS